MSFVLPSDWLRSTKAINVDYGYVYAFGDSFYRIHTIKIISVEIYIFTFLSNINKQSSTCIGYLLSVSQSCFFQRQAVAIAAAVTDAILLHV